MDFGVDFGSVRKASDTTALLAVAAIDSLNAILTLGTSLTAPVALAVPSILTRTVIFDPLLAQTESNPFSFLTVSLIS